MFLRHSIGQKVDMARDNPRLRIQHELHFQELGAYVLQCVAVCCIVLHCVALFQICTCVYIGTCNNPRLRIQHELHLHELGAHVLQCVVVCCSTLQCVAVSCCVLQCVEYVTICINRFKVCSMFNPHI